MSAPAAADRAAFAEVPFRDTTILAARVGNEVRVPMKRFCGTIGLPWDGQRRRIDRDEVLREGAVVMTVPSGGGEQRQTTLPIELIPGFLFGADASRYAPELRDRVRTFRRECYAVLFQHFFGRAQLLQPVVARPPATPGWQELEAARRHAPALVNVITAETRPGVRRYLYELLAHDADRLGLAAPALRELGADAPDPDVAIARLVRGLGLLTERRKKWNHLGKRANGNMAILLPELARLFAAADIDVQIDAALRAALDAGSRRYRITEEVIPSAIARGRVLAIVLRPWPVEGGQQ